MPLLCNGKLILAWEALLLLYCKKRLFGAQKHYEQVRESYILYFNVTLILSSAPGCKIYFCTGQQSFKTANYSQQSYKLKVWMLTQMQMHTTWICLFSKNHGNLDSLTEKGNLVSLKHLVLGIDHKVHLSCSYKSS